MNYKKCFFVGLSLVWATGTLWAQNQSYDQFAPKPVVPAPSQSAPEPVATTHMGGEGSQILLPMLNGLVFAGQPKDIAAKGSKKSTGVVELPDVVIPANDKFKKLAESYVGKPLTRGGLDDMITKIILFYRQNDHPVVDVIIPQQEITGGVIQILLLEAKVGQVSVEGNRWFSDGEIKDGFRTKTGDQILASTVKADLSWINQNPFHTSDVVYEPGAETGVTNIALKTQDRFPARFYVGYEDSGNPETGFDRYLVGVNWGDAWDAGLGQQLNYQYTTSGNLHNLAAHSGSYVIPLPWHHTLTFLGNYIQTEGALPPLISVEGRSYQASARYTIPLPTFGDYKHSFGVGFDYKYNHNSLQFGAVPIDSSPVEVAQFVMAYDASLHDKFGITSFDAQIYVSPGKWTAFNQDANFYGSHTFATSDYAYSTLELTRLTRLPYDFSLFLRGMAQFSNTNLTPSEQLGFGGYDTVRGYDERELNKDEGYVTNVEVRAPVIGLGQLFHLDGFNDQMQLLAFWDSGTAYNHHVLVGESNQTCMSSLGGGFRYTINTNLSLRGDYGFQLTNTGLDNDHGGRGDVSMVLSY